MGMFYLYLYIILKAASLHCRDHWEKLFRYVIPGCCEDHLNALVRCVGKTQLFLQFKMIECYSNLKGFQNNKKEYSEVPLTSS